MVKNILSKFGKNVSKKKPSFKNVSNQINTARIRNNIEIDPTKGLNMADFKLINIYKNTDSIRDFDDTGRSILVDVKTVTKNYFDNLKEINDIDLQNLTIKYQKLYRKYNLEQGLRNIKDKKKLKKINENVKNLVSRLAEFDLSYKRMGNNIVDNITFKTELKKLIDNEQFDFLSSISINDKQKLKNLIDNKKHIEFDDLLKVFNSFDEDSMIEITNRIRRVILNEDVSNGTFLRNMFEQINKITMRKSGRPLFDFGEKSFWKAHKKKLIVFAVVYVIGSIILINKSKDDNNVQVNESNKNSNDESNDKSNYKSKYKSNDNSCKGSLCDTSYDSDYDYDYEDDYDSYYGKEAFSNINEKDFKSDFILNFVEKELENLKDTDDDNDKKMEEITKLLIFYLIDSDEINNKVNEKIVEKNFFEKYKYYIIGIVSFIILLVVIILIL